MAITYISDETIQSDASSDTVSITVPSDCTMLVFAAAGLIPYGDTPTTITVDGDTLTVQEQTDTGGRMHSVLAYLEDPTTGAVDFEWNWSNSVTEGSNGRMIYLKGEDDTTVITSSAQAASGGDVTGMTAGTDDLMIGVASSFQTDFTALTDNGQTVQATGEYNNAEIGMVTKVGGTSFEHTSGNFETACAIVVKAAAGGGATIPPLAHHYKQMARAA